MVRAGPHTFNAAQIRNGNRGLVIKSKDGIEIYPVFIYKKNSKSWTLVRGGPNAKQGNRAMFSGLRTHLENGKTPKERQDLYIQWYQGQEQTDPLYKGALVAASKMLSIAEEAETLKQVEGISLNDNVFENLSRLVKPITKKTQPKNTVEQEVAPKQDGYLDRFFDLLNMKSGPKQNISNIIKQIQKNMADIQDPATIRGLSAERVEDLKQNRLPRIKRDGEKIIKFLKSLEEDGIKTLKQSQITNLQIAIQNPVFQVYPSQTPPGGRAARDKEKDFDLDAVFELIRRQEGTIKRTKNVINKGVDLITQDIKSIPSNIAKAGAAFATAGAALPRNPLVDQYTKFTGGGRTLSARKLMAAGGTAILAAGGMAAAKQIKRRLVNQPGSRKLRGPEPEAGENTGEAPGASTDKQLIDDFKVTNLDTGLEQDLKTGEDIDPTPEQPPEQPSEQSPIEPPAAAPPITPTQATLDPTQQELTQRQQDLATDVKVDTGAVLDEDNIPEIGIQQEGISAIAVKLGYDFTYYKDIVEKQSPPSKDDAKRAKELEICMREYGAFIPIKQDNSYESVLEIYTLKYIYNEHLRFDRKWKMSLINNIRNISQQNMMPGSGAGTGTGLAVSLETMGMSAEEAVKRLTSNSVAAAAPQSGNTGQFRTSQTTGRLPFVSTGRTGERGQPIYNIPPKAGSESSTVPPLSRQGKADVEKTADKKPPVIPDEYKDFIMKYDNNKQKWVKMGRRPKPKQKQYRPNNIKLKIEKPIRFNSNHLYTNLTKFDPPEAGNAPVFRTRNSNNTSNRFTPNYSN